MADLNKPDSSSNSEPKKQNNAFKNNNSILQIILTLLIIILTLSTATLLQQNKKLISYNSLLETKISSLESITPQDNILQPETAKPTNEEVSYQTLEITCSEGQLPGIQLKLSKAYLVDKVHDLPDWKIQEIEKESPEIGSEKFLILESDARNRNTTGQTQTIYADYYFRLRRDQKDYNPIVYGGPTLAIQENGNVYSVFPVKNGESVFKILFCNLSHPRVIDFNFTDNNTETVAGYFSIKEGLINSESE